MMNSSVSCKYHPDAYLHEDYQAGDQICSQCGLVVGDRVIDVGSEWRMFTNDSSPSNKSRVGASENILLGSADLVTHIDPGQGGTSTVYHQKPSENPILTAIHAIADMGDKLHLPKAFTDRALKLFKTVLDGKDLQGRPNEAIAAACLYIACREEGAARYCCPSIMSLSDAMNFYSCAI